VNQAILAWSYMYLNKFYFSQFSEAFNENSKLLLMQKLLKCTISLENGLFFAQGKEDWTSNHFPEKH
jgi:hypothetical protein